MLDRELIYADEAKCQVIDDRLILNIVKSRDGGSGKLVYRADFNKGFFTYLDPAQTEEEAQELRNQYEYEEDNDCPF
jgi:hypothetical protein